MILDSRIFHILISQTHCMFAGLERAVNMHLSINVTDNSKDILADLQYSVNFTINLLPHLN